MKLPEWSIIEKYTNWRLLPFEIVTPEELRTLGISEAKIEVQESFIERSKPSVESKKALSKRKVIGESSSEEEKPASMSEEEWEKFKQDQAKKLAEQKQAPVVINLIGKSPEKHEEKIENVENPSEISQDVDLAKDIIKEGVERLRAEGHIIPDSMYPNNFEELKQLKEMFDREHPKRPPVGSVPLSPAQTGEPEEGFENFESMIDFLRDKASKPVKDKESEAADAVLNELWRKMMAHQEASGQSFKFERKPKEGEPDKPLKEELAERYRRRKGIKKEGEQ